MEIKRFGRIREVIPLPPLTEIQVESYRRALQADVPPEKRENVGIQAAFRETFPIEEEDKGKGGLVLDFLEYRLGEPPFPQDECREKDLTYQAPSTPGSSSSTRTRASSRRTRSSWGTSP